MKSALCPTANEVWLQCSGYKVLPLNRSLYAVAQRLERMIESRLYAKADSRRRDFYDVELTDGWAYIHIRDQVRTIYLIAYANFI